MDTPISISQSLIDGFETIELNTGAVSLSMIPALGGKIASLRDLRTGREWLWRNPRMPYKQTRPGASYVREADTGGWDECFPTVAPCKYPSPPWTGATLQDHGELWSQAVAIEVRRVGGDVVLRSLWQGLALPYRFERTLSISPGTARLHMAYEASNDSGEPIRFIWSAHPLLAIEPGMELQMPPSARFNCASSFPPDLFDQDKNVRFPLTTGGLSTSSLPPAGFRIALKLWSDPLQEGWAVMRARDGELRMRWQSGELRQLASWINLGAWAGDEGEPYYNLGLEPCIGAQDSLTDAVDKFNLAGTIPPRGSRTWALDVELYDRNS